MNAMQLVLLERLAREALENGWPAVYARTDVILALLEERRVLREALTEAMGLIVLREGSDEFEDGVIRQVRAALQAEPARAEEGAS